eukprot:jgi/Undpi1/1623/HiC_scaffold_11.g05013.m1
MLRTRSPSARAAEAAERQVRLQRRQQRQQQQQQQQQANKPVTSPALRNELALNCLSTESNTKINRNGSINISNNDHSTNAIVASAVTPASTRGKGRFSFGPVPNERYSIESGLSFSFSSPSPPPSDDRSCSRTPAPPSPHLQQGGPPPANDGSNNGSESSSCAVIDVNGIDAETNDDHIAYTDQDLLSTSTTSSIELARQLDHASLVLPPHEEIFGFDSPDKKQQQLQHDDLEPIPFIHGSGNSMPDAAVFDFDVDKIDGLIGELAEEEQEEHDHATAVPATTAAFMGPAPAIWADPAIQHAIANAMDVASNANYMTQEAYTHAAALAAQSQVQVGIAWQVVVSAMHTVAVSLKADNEKLLASNAELEAEKRGFIRQISRLGDTVSTLITQRDRLAADLRESGTGSPTKTSAKGNRTRDDSGCVVYDCTSPASGMGMFLATPASATTLCDRTAEAAAATAAAVAAFSTPTVKPAMVSRTGTVTGQPGSMMTTAAVPAVMNAIKETITTTMAPQQCEVGLPIQTIPPSGSHVRPKMAADKSRRRSVKTPGSTTGGRAPWVGGGVGGGAFPSPPIVGNREKDASPSVSLSERLENEMRQEDAKRTPLGSSRINTGPRSVSSTAGKGRKASPCISTPPLAQASSTRGIENQPREGNKPRATVAVKRIIADDRGATDGNQPNPEGMYGRLRSAGRPRKMKTKVVAGGGKKVVSGTGVSSRSRQEAAANRGAAGGRSKAAPKQRWR